MLNVVLLSLALVAADPVEDPAAKILESTYQAVSQKADADAAKIKKVANEKRLKGYRDLLKKHTQAGDFAKATAVKARVDELEAERVAVVSEHPAGSVSFGDHVYLFIPTDAGWVQAKRRCEQLKGHLITIESADEMEFALKLCNGKNGWIGATDEKKQGEWKWVNGEPVDMRLLKDVKLDNSGGVQHWMVMKLGRQVVDAGSDLKCGFICEWDK